MLGKVKSLFSSHFQKQPKVINSGQLEAALTMETELIARHIRDGKEIGRRVVKNKKITDVFVAAIVDALQAQTYINTWKYHDCGTGVAAESAADTALGTPCGEARDVGTQIEGVTGNIYKSVATHTFAGSFAITEHGLFNAAAVGTLMDRTVFAAINVVASDKIEWTFQITFNSGG
jgi:hypothetical protein